MTERMGRANYLWDDQLECHIPCCRRCGNGPLIGNEEESGICAVCWTATRGPEGGDR